MTYATELVQHYRLALRYLWDVHFRLPQFAPDLSTVRDFDCLKLPLYRALPARRLEPLGEEPGAIFGATFSVVPPLN